MKTLKSACKPRDSIFDPTRRDTVLDLTDLAEGRIDPREFFAENHITEGMRILLTEGFRRLEGKSTQGVFKLTQAMGGGKTHNLLAFGLLARHPEYRRRIMRDFYTPEDIGRVPVVAFSGRESDAPLGIWGAIAERLSKREQFKDYYSPLSAPGQTAWINLLQGEPLLIMLDELPPYFVNAAAKSIGNSDLSVVTGTALSNLLVAIGREELSNVCLVITDLTASYGSGSQQIINALQDLEKETGRAAMNLEPVRMNSDEFYQILRKRIFEALPAEDDIAEIAQGYAKAVRDARQMDITNASPEQFAQRITESYPFHPAIRDLYARFRENPGFQQTRGLIRLMRIVAARLWSSDEDRHLIAAQDLDLTDRETLTEINQINNTLENAVAHDITSSGQAVAEVMDTNLGGQDARDVMRLLLVASLANVPGAVRGLAIPEIIANLCAPDRDISRLQNEVISRLVTAAWYLHTAPDGRLFLKNVQNLIARVTTTANAYLRDQAIRELKERLQDIFKPETGWCYQRVLTLPAVDEIEITQDRITLVISEPHQDGLHPDLRTFYEQLTYPNRIGFLSGQRALAFNALLDRAKELKLNKADFLMEFKENRYRGEEQVIQTLRDKQKYTEDVSGELFRKKVEARLLTQKSMPWSEVKRRAATTTAWQWHRPDALDKLKAECAHKDVWREEGNYIEKGPFPKPATTVKIQEFSRDDDTGRVKLKLTPVNGDTLYAEIGGRATTASMKLEGRDFETEELEVSFLAVDSTGTHETGEPVTWRGRITLKSRDYFDGDTRVAELRTAPAGAIIRYTTDGSDPRVNGGTYEGPFPVPDGARFVLAYAESAGIISEVHRREIEEGPEPRRQIDHNAPAVWRRRVEFQTTHNAYGFLNRMKKHGVKASGLRLAVLGKQWADLSLSEDVALDGEQAEQTVEVLRALVPEGEVTIEALYVQFETGQRLLDYAQDIKIDLNLDEVEQ